MTRQQHQAWSVVGAMFVTIAITWGVGFDIVGLFYDSFFKEFGWTHAHFALLSTAFSVSLFVGGLTVGWLLDHVEAKIVVTGGALTAMAGLLLAGTDEHNGYRLVGEGPDALPHEVATHSTGEYVRALSTRRISRTSGAS
jgi:fucose permease